MQPLSPADFSSETSQASAAATLPADAWLDGLNARQREAVTHPSGPILVVAGPGTGKTQLLAARAAWVTGQPGGPRPGQLLCLTYTDAAASSMRQRLLRLLGPAGHDIAVHTFHSFGRLIIDENPEIGRAHV